MSELRALPASRAVHGKERRRRPRRCHHPGARNLMPCRPNLIIPLHAPQRTAASQQNPRYLKAQFTDNGRTSSRDRKDSISGSRIKSRLVVLKNVGVVVVVGSAERERH
ncbi:hypothetical protein GW17_00033908 [Ensete ventricosum]|nr:hypothetical protein GW17_00033908 [Ensete ventricosum]